MRTIIRRWQSIVTISSLVVYVLSFAIPVALPRIAKAESEVVYNLGGYVYINGQPAWNGFGVKVVVNGAARWATVGSGGWYEFRDGNALPPGAYAIQHNHGCPSNAPLQVTVPAHNNRAPNLNINCPTHTLAGYVYINGRPAWKGFGVKANLGSLETEWAVVENDSGWYQFRDGSALIAGTWTIGHNHNCPSNMPVQWGIPAPNNRGPDLQINCPSYPLHGYVYVNGKPAWEKFGVKAVLSDGTEKWALTDANGWYDFKDSNALIAGNYTISHNHNCPSNAPIAISIPANNNKGPDIHINCPTYTLTGNVYVDGRPAWIGFGVKAVLRDGTEKWALVENSQGLYQFKDANRLIAGEYTIGHNHNCPSNMPVQWSVPASGDRGPNVEITCPTHTLNGHVHINGTPAWIGFGVKAVAADGSEKWALVENNQGWYQFKDANRLAAGSYTIHHNHNCPSTTPVSINIPATDNRGPDINITCPTHSLSGTVYVDGKPAWEKFGVKAVKDGKVTWALTDGNGYYSFQNLEPGTYSVGHVHPCTTDGGNPITVNMDGNKTADFRITCVSEPSPTPEPDNRTCREILDELGISMVSTASNQYTDSVYLPIVAHDSTMTSINPVPPIDNTVMDADTFIRFATQIDEMEHYITATVGISSTHFTFFHEKARGAGFSEDLIDLTNQMVMFQNDLLSEENVSSAATDMASNLYDNYPLLSLYMDAATNYANSPQAASAMDEVRGLGTETCVCGGSMMFPRPERGAERKILGYENSESEAYTTLYLHGFRETWDYVPDELVRDAGYTRRQTWHPEYCGVDTYRDEGNISVSEQFPGKWTVWIQDYDGISPRGEPNPEIFLHGVDNWPTPFWGVYVIQWHDKY